LDGSDYIREGEREITGVKQGSGGGAAMAGGEDAHQRTQNRP
jgi:hypothetical protein